MTTKTFIRLTIVSLTLTIGVVLFSAYRGRTSTMPAGEETQCREKNGANCTQRDNPEIWESISRHLLGATE